MAPFEPEGFADWPETLRRHCGPVKRVRCLSSRTQRQVYLVEDETGRMRIFKILTGLNAESESRFVQVRRRLAGIVQCEFLLPILAFSAGDDAAWEELAMADHADSGRFTFDDYSPRRLDLEFGSGLFGSVESVVRIARQVFAALVHLQQLALIHGDVKPGNVLRFQGRWVLADFDTLGSEEDLPMVTASTEGYQPPGGGSGTERDTYALGKLVYELWTGNGRLEYPALPPRLLLERKWNRKDRLLNDLTNALCSPVGVSRLRRLETVETVFTALERGSGPELAAAEKCLRPGRRVSRWKSAGAVLVCALVALLAWTLLRNAAPARLHVSIGRNDLVGVVYHHPERVNEGYVRKGTDGPEIGLMMFNAHLSLLKPLEVGDVVDLVLVKDVWRGHVAAYLSEQPFFKVMPPEFGHREHFGRMNHLMFFHVDGDMLVDPTQVVNGKPEPFPPGFWDHQFKTNTLRAYHVELAVEERQLHWVVSSDGTRLAEGHSPSTMAPAYLGLYAYDNTLCYIRSMAITNKTSRIPTK